MLGNMLLLDQNIYNHKNVLLLIEEFQKHLMLTSVIFILQLKHLIEF